MFNLKVNQNSRLHHSANCLHIQTEEGHPGGPIGLAEDTTSGQRLRAIKGTNIV